MFNHCYCIVLFAYFYLNAVLNVLEVCFNAGEPTLFCFGSYFSNDDVIMIYLHKNTENIFMYVSIEYTLYNAP